MRLKDGLTERLRRTAHMGSGHWDFPKAGWWASRAMLIAGALWLGYALGRRDNY